MNYQPYLMLHVLKLVMKDEGSPMALLDLTTPGLQTADPAGKVLCGTTSS